MWYLPNACGYTPDIKRAGTYTAEETVIYEDAETVAVPVEWLHANARIRMVVDASDEHVMPGVFWSAAQLRAACGAASNDSRESLYKTKAAAASVAARKLK